MQVPTQVVPLVFVIPNLVLSSKHGRIVSGPAAEDRDERVRTASPAHVRLVEIACRLRIDELVTCLWHGRCFALPVVWESNDEPPLAIGIHRYRMSLSCI
jgi:hypothetical protein